ncbi:MAG: anthranilate phosphoribosyltransferase [Pseudomonadota bacterium]
MDALKPILQTLGRGEALAPDEATKAFEILMEGEATDAQIGAFLMGLHRRGETVDDLSAAVSVLRKAMVPVSAPEGALCNCGTGGDAKGTVNVSTAAALVIAACGVPVAKHGNRALTSRSGSSQVLEALGLKIDLSPADIETAIKDIGMGFMMAPQHHPALRHVGPARMQIGFRTIFNLLGPLLNPARVKFQLLGVFDRKWLEPIAETAGRSGATRLWVVHGSDGMDELTTTGESHVAEWRDGAVRSFKVTPEEAGLARADISQLKGGDPAANAKSLRAVLAGEAGAYRDIVVLNAAGALVVAGKAQDLKSAAALASEAIDSGKALALLDRLAAFTQERSPS